MSKTPPFRRGDRQVWHGRPHAPSNLLAYRGRKNGFIYAGAAMSVMLGLLILNGMDESVEGYSVVLFLVSLLPLLVGIGIFLVFAWPERAIRRSTRYGVTSTRAIIQTVSGELRYTVQPDDSIERVGGTVRFNDGRVKRVWEEERTGTKRQSYLRRKRPDGFSGLTEAEAIKAEAALLAARDAARDKTTGAEAA